MAATRGMVEGPDIDRPHGGLQQAGSYRAGSYRGDRHKKRRFRNETAFSTNVSTWFLAP